MYGFSIFIYLPICLRLSGYLIIHLFIVYLLSSIFKVPQETHWLGMTAFLSQPRTEIMETATRSTALFSTTEHGGTVIFPCDQILMDGTIHKRALN